ncbi:type IV-A pilus assembly ATPase PilB [Acinetobacter larvae]|uniref:Type IV-A pilus assembly ATPase PilB n=1 Tax=Acinetobacter larvae TaxID=1789224 RepID=A0A1B2M3M0_9GAMM|nr:type IV-A pilus assembly ATPase PilB [Acinetobacter larvae]
MVLSGLLRRFVEQQLLSQDAMLLAMQQAEAQQKHIIAYLVDELHLNAAQLAQQIGLEFNETVLDLSHYDPDLLPKNLINPSLLHYYQVLPLGITQDRLRLAMSDPSRLDAIQAIGFHSNLNIEPVLVTHDQLCHCLDQYFPDHHDHNFQEQDLAQEAHQGTTTEELIPASLVSHNEDTPIVVRYLNKLVADALHLGASDLHFEPYANSYRVRYRIDGLLHSMSSPPPQLALRIAARLKVMAQLDIAEKRIPQDGRIRFHGLGQHVIDLRISTLPTLFGEKIVLRILDTRNSHFSFEQLGLNPQQSQLFLDNLYKPQGMLLITGPTGSGKTASLYSGLRLLNQQHLNISTVEDPVEIQLEGINQVNVNPKAGLDFATALKAFLRQDPDIMMLGEIRDIDTAELAIKAAQTGHLVLSTLHTNSAAETLTRLRHMGIAAFNIASAVNLVIAQRLLRRLCPHCKYALDVPLDSLYAMGFHASQLQHHPTLYQAAQCNKCHDGYKGRFAIYEMLPITPEIHQLILRDASATAIAQQAEQQGFNNLHQAALTQVLQGQTSLQEVNRVLSHALNPVTSSIV